MNLSESLAQYTVKSFASFLSEEGMMTTVGQMGNKTKTKDSGDRGKTKDKPGAGGQDGPGAGDDGALAGLLAAWGSDNPTYDYNGDGVVDGADLTILLGRG